MTYFSCLKPKLLFLGRIDGVIQVRSNVDPTFYSLVGSKQSWFLCFFYIGLLQKLVGRFGTYYLFFPQYELLDLSHRLLSLA